MAWTDERLDDLAARMDAGFGRTERDIRDLRIELRDQIGGVRAELKGDIDGLRTVMVRVGVAIMVCLAGVIATLIGVIATGSIAG